MTRCVPDESSQPAAHLNNMAILTQLLGDSAGAKVLLVLGVIMLVCGGSACWCRFARWRSSKGCDPSPRRW